MVKNKTNKIGTSFIVFIFIFAVLSFIFYINTYGTSINDSYIQYIHANNDLTLDGIKEIRESNGLPLKLYDFKKGKIASINVNYFSEDIKIEIEDDFGKVTTTTVGNSSINIVDINNETYEHVRKTLNENFVMFPSKNGTIFNKRTAQINSFVGSKIYVLQYASRYNDDYDVLILK